MTFTPCHLRCVGVRTSQVRSFSSNASQYAMNPLGQLGKKMLRADQEQGVISSIFGTATDPANASLQNLQNAIEQKAVAPHHLHVYATKHNTHMTLTAPNRNSIISRSAGNLGFKKSARGTYDAAYQLSAYMLGQIYERDLLNTIRKLEIVLRGFGVGREAVTKALLGPEGRRLRPYIVQVSDSTRLKFGGTRSRKPRRLG